MWLHQRGGPDYTGQQCGCTREVVLIIQVKGVAALDITHTESEF